MRRGVHKYFHTLKAIVCAGALMRFSCAKSLFTCWGRKRATGSECCEITQFSTYYQFMTMNLLRTEFSLSKKEK